MARVELSWDGVEVVATADLKGGFAASTLVVPASAKPGLHLLTAQCEGLSNVADRRFQVPEPIVDPPTPPDPKPNPNPVPDPDPVEPSPVLVAVPSVVGASLPEARKALRARELRLGQVLGDRQGIVQQQRPRAGRLVRAGTPVRVSLVAQPLPLVTVPDVVGRSSTEAAAVLSASGLALGDGATDDREISRQDPVAGSLVPEGSTVRVAYAEPGGWAGGWGRPAVALAAVLLGLAAGMAALRRVKRRLDDRWVRLHDVRLEQRAAVDPVEVASTIQEGAAPTLTVRIEPHHDIGSIVLEERNRS